MCDACGDSIDLANHRNSDNFNNMKNEYESYLDSKLHECPESGFEPVFMPDFLFDFQKHITEKMVRRGRAACFADCGLGKTAMELTWCQNVVEKTNKPTLFLTPLAVANQVKTEGEKFGIDCAVSRDGKITSKITVTNYQQIHKFNPNDFAGVCGDESAILKNCDGQIRADTTEFMRRVPYRSLWSATPAPNDYIELGTSSEALGYLGFMDMVNRFFKKAESTCSRSDEFRAGVYRFRGHAQREFWRWVCSWATACRKPSDLGFSDHDFTLPPLVTREHIFEANEKADGFLFNLPAVSLHEQRGERKRTLEQRCEMAATIANGTHEPIVLWCHLNPEGDLLEKLIPDSVQLSGKDSDDKKEGILSQFARGEIRALVTKPILAGWGLNWQHCAHQTFFPSHSFEQWYQSVRRSWRFGQKRQVVIDIIASEGERGVLHNMQRKSAQAEKMFAQLVELMNDELRLQRENKHTNKTEIPSWL